MIHQAPQLQRWASGPSLLTGTFLPPLPQPHQLSEVVSWFPHPPAVTPHNLEKTSKNKRKTHPDPVFGPIAPHDSQHAPLHFTWDLSSDSWIRDWKWAGTLQQEEGRGGDTGGQLGREKGGFLPWECTGLRGRTSSQLQLP